MPDQASPGADRPAVGGRRKVSPGLAVIGIAVAAMVGYAIWAGTALLRQVPLVPTVSTYTVVSDQVVSYRLVVTGPANDHVRCAVRARADDFVVVGQDERTLDLGPSGSAAIEGRVSTLRRAANAEAGSCEQVTGG
jgi:Domain of unknown function (DUF4307)